MKSHRSWNKLLSQPVTWVIVLLLLFIIDTILSSFIINKVPYTEIDWKAYMEEVEGFLSGERDYTHLKGNTGPLVYPAAFLYIFSVLRYLTNEGRDILTAQYIFMGLYLVNFLVVGLLYISSNNARLNIWAMIPLIVSKRIHSIYILRMFNDCVAIFFGYLALYLFTKNRWYAGSFIYSIAVGVKMNLLLFAPGILAVYLMNLGLFESFKCLAICGLVQIAIGWPFLSTYPIEYLSKAFELGRVFFYKWTVNYKFMPEDIFVSKGFSVILLVLTVLAYILFAIKWTQEFRKGYGRRIDSKAQLKTSPRFLIYIVLTSNILGVIFARTLHYQFYCWYFHSLPLLVLQTDLHWIVSFALMGVIEFSFNVFPATPISSLLLQISHFTILIALYFSPIPLEEGQQAAKIDTKEKEK